MRNKIWIVALCCMVSLPAMANSQMAFSSDAKQDLNNKVSQTVLQQTLRRKQPVLPWVQLVREEQSKVIHNSVLETPVYGAWSTLYKQRSVPAKQKEQYGLYMRMFQNLLDTHLVFAGYKFQATVPEMLANLSWDEYSFLSAFFEQPITLWDADPNFLPQSSKLEDAVIKLEFEWTQGAKYILLVNTARKRVYFFAGEIVE